MKQPLIVFLLSLWLAAGLLARDRPNVVILFTDDQGTLDVNCYGSTDLRTPHLDQLAKTGVRFTQAYAHMVCCPSRAALFTGRHPQRGGVTHWTQGDRNGSDAGKTNMATEELTLAEVLKAEGYRTALFGKWHLGAKLGHGPLDQGFDTFFGHLGGFIDNYRHYFMHGQGFHDLYDGNEEVFRREEYFPDLILERALDYIEDNQDAPFFFTLALNLPHYPEQPIEKFKDAYPDLEMPRQSYARMISSVDDHVGQILAKLEATGLRDNTVVIMMSDNGHSAESHRAVSLADHASGYPAGHYYSAHGGGGNTGKWIGHKAELLEGGIRVPAMISYPGRIPAGETRDQVITVMDWFPTVLELCGIEAAPNAPKLDGHSVVPVIEDSASASAHAVIHFSWGTDWAVREGKWKLIAKENKEGRLMKVSLHNLEEKNPEVRDHASTHPAIVAQLTARHRALEAEIDAE